MQGHIRKRIHNTVEGDVWNDALVDVYRVSHAHCMFTVVRTFHDAVAGRVLGA